MRASKYVVLTHKFCGVGARSYKSMEPWHCDVVEATDHHANILDRLVHNAHRLTLKGGSLRNTAAKRAGLNLRQDA